MKHLLLITLVLFISECRGQLRLLLENTTAPVGENATILCKYDAGDITGSPKITWYSLPTDSDERQRLYIYFMNPDDGISTIDPQVRRDLSVNSEGSLVIPSVTLNDNQMFSILFCEVDFGQPGDLIDSLSFTVVALPSPPVADLEETSFDPSEFPIKIGSCVSGAGYPAPKITFYREGQRLHDGDLMDTTSDPLLQDVIEDPLDNGTFSTRRSLFSTISMQDDKAQFMCRVTSGVGSDTRVQDKNFPVLRVNHNTTDVTITHIPQYAIKGQQYSLKCEANGYPEPTIVFDGAPRDVLEFIVTDADKERVVVCTAGDISRVFTINPYFVDEPVIDGEKSVNYGDSLTLSCVADANPEVTKTTWKKNKETVLRGNRFTKSSASFDDSGSYTCAVENGYPTLNRNSKSVDISVNGLNLDSESVDVMGKVNEVASLSCKVVANPEPTFEWLKPDNTTVPSEKIIPSPETYTYTSIIEVHLEPSMSKQQYRCRVSNVAGSKVMTFTFPELLEQAGAPVAAIVIIILVILLLIAVTLAVLYNKGYLRKKSYVQGEETAEDISMNMNEKDAEKGQEEAENGAKEEQEEKDAGEEQGLVKKNGEKEH